MEINDYKHSKFLKYNYQAIYQSMLDPVADEEYACWDEFALIFEEYITETLESLNLDCFPHPRNLQIPFFKLERESFPVFIPENADGSGEMSPYLLAKLTNFHPLNHREKPSGFIFEDFSYLQMELTLAHSLSNNKIYVLFHTFHYGRIKEEKEVYFFRFDKESNYQFEGSTPVKLNYKPVFHFHGNSDDPHFKDQVTNWREKVYDVLSTLKINIPRLLDKYNECDYIS